MVFLVAIGIGMALALLASLIKPVVVDQQSLSKLTGLPLLGSVTLIPTPQQKKQESLKLLAYSSLAAVLILVLVGINIGQIIMMS